MRPLYHARNQAMFDRVVMDVIHMSGKIIVIAHGVPPESPLPQAISTFCVARQIYSGA